MAAGVLGSRNVRESAVALDHPGRNGVVPGVLDQVDELQLVHGRDRVRPVEFSGATSS